MTGTIIALRLGGFGFIASDALDLPVKLPFRREVVAGNGFERHRAGQRVRFARVPVPGNPGRFHAVRVAPCPDPATEATVGNPGGAGPSGSLPSGALDLGSARPSGAPADPEILGPGHRMRLDRADFPGPTAP